MSNTPKSLGFSMPAEWEKHSAVWFAWPNDDTTFLEFKEEVEKKYCQILKEISTSEKVNLIVNKDNKTKVEKLLKDYNINNRDINFHITDYNDVWVRDYMPTFISNYDSSDIIAVKWGYNGYGKLEDPYFSELIKDNNTFYELNNKINFKILEPKIILEGGAIEVNGKGTLITTEQCLLNKNRNPNLSKEDNEKYLREYLGVENIIWLKYGLVNDHTDGHIDEIARFVKEDTIVCSYEEDINDPNFNILDTNFKILENAVDKNGNKFKVIKLPMPHMYYDNGEKAPVSYTNFYIGNSVILFPFFNDPNDEKAINIIKQSFINRKVVGIDCSKIIYGGGSLHCITMQEPAI